MSRASTSFGDGGYADKPAPPSVRPRTETSKVSSVAFLDPAASQKRAVALICGYKVSIMAGIKASRRFQIVEFYKENTKKTIKVYIVPTKWLGWDSDEHVCTCKFMGPPYNAVRKALLNEMIRTNSDPERDWIAYPIVVRGDAETYEKAEKKAAEYMKNDKLYAYTTDNEERAEQQSASMMKKFKDAAHGGGKTADEILYSSQESLTEHEKSSSESDSCRASEKRGRINKPQTTQLQKPLPKKPTKKSNAIYSDESEDMESESTEKNTTVAKNKATNQSKTEPVAKDAPEHPENDGGDTTRKTIPLAPRPLAKIVGKADYSKDALILHTAINRLTMQSAEQTEQLRQLKNTIERSLKIRVDDMTLEKFAEKYDVAIKMEEYQNFEAFEEKLSGNDDMRVDFMKSLRHLVEDDMAKTMVTVMKRMFHRSLALKLTAVRQTKDKHVMKGTIFYELLFELCCKECQGDGNVVTEKMFSKALGNILNNCKDWDGQRNARRPPANNPPADGPLANDPPVGNPPGNGHGVDEPPAGNHEANDDA